MVELAHPGSVVDVGCGTGDWLAAFRDLGVERVLGVDGDWVPRDQLQIDPDDFVAADLRRGVGIEERFDLALCLELVEHLPAESASGLVADLTRLAPVVLFSAAVPGQPGHGHVNPQWPEYWVSLFETRGYDAIDAIRPSAWADDSISYFYRQNAIVFVDRERLDEFPRLAEVSAATGPVRAVVHPRLYEVYFQRDIRRRLSRWVGPVRGVLRRLRSRT
jgi:SAM-dependent methyltransferase